MTNEQPSGVPVLSREILEALRDYVDKAAADAAFHATDNGDYCGSDGAPAAWKRLLVSCGYEL